jgi:hypothetical protein
MKEVVLSTKTLMFLIVLTPEHGTMVVWLGLAEYNFLLNIDLCCYDGQLLGTLQVSVKN